MFGNVQKYEKSKLKEWVTKDAKEAENCPILSLNDAGRGKLH